MAKASILVVEDYLDALGFLQLWLESQGFDVQTAGNGREALSLLKHYHPDLILTDLEMPEVNGIDLIQRVRAQSATPPIIVMTASDEGRMTEAVRAGANAVLRKPEDFGHIVEVINQILAEVRCHKRIGAA